MEEQIKAIVYLTNGLNGQQDSVNFREIESYLKSLTEVTKIWFLPEIAKCNLKHVTSHLKKNHFNRVVIAGSMPGLYKDFIKKALILSGKSSDSIILADFREHGAIKKNDTKTAEGIIDCALYNIPYESAAIPEEKPVNSQTLIIGGGIAGIQAALDIAKSNNKVFLVEKKGTIGGHMAMFDKTFPTLDCAACILTPKMVEVAQNPNIELLTYSEIEHIDINSDNYKVKIRKKAKYVLEDKCTGCGKCTEVCQIEVPKEFDLGLVNRKAIYRDFPQAIPNTFIINKTGMASCKIDCPIAQDAQGYLVLVAQGKFKEAHELIRRANALPSICGRACYHHCEDSCRRGYIDEPVSIRNMKRYITENYPSDDIHLEKAPPTGKKVAIIGSGPAGLSCAHDLALKGHEAVIYEKYHIPGGMLIAGIPEFRLPRNVLEKDIDFIKNLGVKIKCNTEIGKDIKLEELKKNYDAIFIATGAHKSLKLNIPNEDAKGIIHGVYFLRKVHLGEEISVGEKVIVVGGGNTAIDSARVALRLGAKDVKIVYRRTLTEMPAIPEEINAAREEGIEIIFLAGVKEIKLQGDKIRQVVFVKMKLGEPDESGRRSPVEIPGKNFTLNADTLIPAVSPCSDIDFLSDENMDFTKWNTIVADNTSLMTKVEGIFAGGDVVSRPASIVEAMGMARRAAIAIDNYLFNRSLDENMDIFKKPEISKLTDEEVRNLKRKYKSIPRNRQNELNINDRKNNFNEVEQTFTDEQAIAEAKRCLNCTVCSVCRECEKVCEFKAINHEMKDEILEIEVGNIILATGFKTFQAERTEEFGYGKFPNVITSLELERIINASGPTNGNLLLRTIDKNGRFIFSPENKKPKSIAIIHCVGSRDENYNKYCSRVCCMYSLKLAHLVKEKSPDAEVYEYYIDMRAFGKGYEEFYNRIDEEGVHIIKGLASKIAEQDGQLILSSEDIRNDRLIEQKVDMVILSVGLEHGEDAFEISEMLGISIDENGWFTEANSNSNPVGTFTREISVAGACQGPKDIPDTVVQASAAACRVLQRITKGKIKQSNKDAALEKIESEVTKTTTI